MILKSWGRGHRVMVALLVAVPLGIYWMLAAQMSWRPRTLIQLDNRAAVQSMSLSLDGERMVVIGSELGGQSSLSVWTHTGQLMWSSSTEAALAFFGSDGKTVMSHNTQYNKLELRNAVTGKLEKAWDCEGFSGYEIAASSDGKMLAGGHPDYIQSVYDLSRVTQPHPLLVHRFKGRKGAIKFAFSSDNRTLATVIWNGEYPEWILAIQLWDTRTWKLQRKFEVKLEQVVSLAFSPDGQVLASVGELETKLWNPRNGKLLRSLVTGYGPITFSPDGKVLATGSERNIKLWDVRTGALLRELVGHRDEVKAIAFSPDGTALLSGSYDGTVRQWRIK